MAACFDLFRYGSFKSSHFHSQLFPIDIATYFSTRGGGGGGLLEREGGGGSLFSQQTGIDAQKIWKVSRLKDSKQPMTAPDILPPDDIGQGFPNK